MNKGESFFKQGIQFFESEQYEQAVACLVQAYEHSYEKEHILDILYNCFIIPNEQEFRYKYNSAAHTRIAYEECMLDFIPVSDVCFYIFNREEAKFEGLIELEDKPVRGTNVRFDSILYTDIWDIRQILPDLHENYWGTVYILLNGQEAKFASFFKLPHFHELYLENVVVFPNEKYMQIFFEEYEEFYLPKQLVTNQTAKYLNQIHRLHENRVKNIDTDRKNIFLSICILSFRNHSVAVQNALQLLKCPYDSEIEILILQNRPKEYEQIKDARVRFCELENGDGYASAIWKALELVQGQYAVFMYETDSMIVDELEKYLSFIKAHAVSGVFLESGDGEIFSRLPEKESAKGYDALRALSEQQYLTGITYNMKLFRSISSLDFMDKVKENRLLEEYTHICIATLLCRFSSCATTGMLLWKTKSKESLHERKDEILEKQKKAFLEFRSRNILPEVYKRNMELRNGKNELDYIYDLLSGAVMKKNDLFECLLLKQQYMGRCFMNGIRPHIEDVWNHSAYFMQAMQETLNMNYSKIPLQERNADFIVIAAAQLLSVRHAPTRIILEICRLIEKYLQKQVFLMIEITVTEEEKCWDLGFFGHEVNYTKTLTGNFGYPYNGDTYYGYQVILAHQNIREMKQVMQHLYQKKPYCVWCFGGIPAFAGAMRQFTTMVYTQFNEGYPGFVTDIVVNYFERAAASYPEEKNFLLEHNVIIQDINIGMNSYQKSSGKLKRSSFDIPEDAFCIGIAGNRLHSDCTDAFLNVLKKIVQIHTAKKICLIFIGETSEAFEKKVAEYVTESEQLRFIGYQKEFAEAVALIDLLAATPGLGNGGAGVTAMNEGKPVVCLNSGDIAACTGDDFQCGDITQYPEMIRRYIEDEDYYEMQSKKVQKQFESLLVQDEEIAVQIKNVLEMVKET